MGIRRNNSMTGNSGLGQGQGPRKPPKVQPVKPPKSPKQPKIPKVKNVATKNYNSGHWGLKGTALALTSILLVILSVGNITGNSILNMFGKRGIQANMESPISGYTISQLGEVEFTVANKSRRDSSEDTVWYLEGEEVGRGTNSIHIDKTKFKWGANVLEAMNNDDSVVYTVVLEKSQSDTDKLHNMLSMMSDYSSGWFANHQEYIQVDTDTLTDSIKTKYNIVDYGNGFFKTKQEFKDNLVALETTESILYSLEVGEPVQLPEALSGDYAVQVRGTWDNVEEATLSFDLQGDAQENWTPVTFKNGKISNINKDKYIYSNGKLIVTIKESGIYLLRPSHLDNDNLKIRYDIAIIELTDTDKINNTELAGIEIGLGPATAGQQLNTEYYEGFLNSLENDADSRTKIELNFNVLSWSNNVAMLSKDGVKFIRDYTNSSVENALLSLVDREQSNIYSKNSLIIFDVSKLSNERIRQVANLIARLADYDTYNIKFVVIGSSIGNIKALDDIPNTTVVYELSSINEATSMVESLNSSLVVGSEIKLVTDETGKISISDTKGTVKDNEVKVIKIADTLFSYDKNAILTECTFNENLQTSNSFGQSLLLKLAFNGQFRSGYVDSGNPLRTGYTEDAISSNIKLTELGVTVNSETEKNINNAQLGGVDNSELSRIISTLTFSQLNYSGSSLINPQKITQDGGYSYFIEALANELNTQGPVIATMGCQYGYETILITSISEEKDNAGNYYIHFYNPMNPVTEQIATLKMYRGLDENTKNVGYGVTFNYENDGVQFNTLHLVSPISIYDDNEEVYRVDMVS